LIFTGEQEDFSVAAAEHPTAEKGLPPGSRATSPLSSTEWLSAGDDVLVPAALPTGQ
jgi:hypothetical protein